MGQTNFSALKHFSVKAYFKGERKMCHIIKQLMTFNSMDTRIY